MNGHILIIDDEASLRQTLARILQRAGFDVTTAANGTEGIALATNQPFDLIYLDIRMPDMNGLDALQTLRAKLPEVPILLFTAQPDIHSAVEALRRGATDYLLKPLKPQAVIDRTTNILTQHQKNRRKRELQRQMEALQTELDSLEQVKQPEKETPPLPLSDRHLQCGSLVLDLHTRRITFKNREINLQPASFDYLLTLTRHSPNTVDYQTLVAESQGYEANLREAQELTKWHIHNIRQALEEDTRHPTIVINMRGKGYRLIAD